jgi:hypothetical protein
MRMTSTSMTEYQPLYPYHGEPYHQAMQAAQHEYDTWLELGGVRGITIYSRYTPDEEDIPT